MIEIKDLSKKYGDHIIFDKYNLTIDSGKMIAIAGASGCGKTTLLNILGMLDFDYSGNIEIDDVKISRNMKNKVSFFRNTLGYLFQNYALADNLSVSKNLDFALEYRICSDKELLKKEALIAVGLNPEQYLSKKIFTLSGGEQQRVALARLILKPCNIILADEPTGSLDEKNRDEVLKILRALNSEGKTVIIVTHDPYVMEACDSIVHI